MSKGTTRRTVRVDPQRWESARTIALERGENLSDVIRDALDAYIEAYSGTP